MNDVAVVDKSGAVVARARVRTTPDGVKEILRLLAGVRSTANRILKATGHQWAFCTLTRSPGCRAPHDRRRAAGDRHAAALRNLYRRLLGCLHHCLATETACSEEQAFPSHVNRPCRTAVSPPARSRAGHVVEAAP